MDSNKILLNYNAKFLEIFQKKNLFKDKYNYTLNIL